MTAPINDGGQAFPLSAHPEHGYGPAASVNNGMSLRAYFAGQCIAGLMANPTEQAWEAPRDTLAEWAVKQADALIKRLEQP